MLYPFLACAEMPKPFCNTPCFSKNQKIKNGGECIQLDGKQIYIRKLGEGKATVIFSSGTGISADTWFDSGIAEKIAKDANVLAYDRVYTFNSCHNENDFIPVTANDVTEDLHKLITELKLPPPYILVGHSMGGLYMMHYARHYPKDIAGIVLLDATSDEGPTPLPKAALPILKKLGNPQNPDPNNFLYNEMIGQLPSYIQAKQSPPLPQNIPMIVLSATRHCLPLAWTKTPMCMTEAQELNHQRQQRIMAKMSSNSQFLLISGDHNVFFTKGNGVVIEAIKKFVTAHFRRAVTNFLEN